MSHRLNMQWVQVELIPFLDLVFNVVTGHTPKKHDEWEALVARAESRINTIRNYDDSIISIDRIRLTLTSSPNLEAEDRAQTAQIIGDQELIVTMLVRHSISHGPYPLISLGVGKNPDALRERELLRQKGQKLPNIVTVKTGRNRGGGGLANYARKNNRGAFGRNQGLKSVYDMNHFAAQPADLQAAIYYPTTGSAGFAAWPYQFDSVDQLDKYKDAYPQESYGAGIAPQPISNNVSGSSMVYPQPALAAYENSTFTIGYTDPVSDQLQSISPQGCLQSSEPVFVPGRKVHNSLHAPEFHPGADEHVTLSMIDGHFY